MIFPKAAVNCTVSHDKVLQRVYTDVVPGGERGGVHVPDEQTGLTGHGESGAAQRLPLQRADGPLTAVLQRGARGAAGTLQDLHWNCFNGS